MSGEEAIRIKDGKRRTGRIYISIPTTGRTGRVLQTNRHDMLEILPRTSPRTPGIYDRFRTDPSLSNPGRLGRRSCSATQQIPHVSILFWRTEELQPKRPHQSTPHQTTMATRFCQEPKCHGHYPWTYPCSGCPDRRRKSYPPTGREVFQMSQKGTHEQGLSG